MKNIKDLKPNKNSKFKQGIYKIENPHKYVGDIHNIIYRSSWELKFCRYCDLNPNILKWVSEPFPITFWNPIDKKTHKYNPDYYIKVKKKDGSEENWILEIKPSSQYQLDKKPILKSGNLTEKKIQSYNHQMETWIVNRAKFDAAMRFAAANGYKFGAIDENFIFK